MEQSTKEHSSTSVVEPVGIVSDEIVSVIPPTSEGTRTEAPLVKIKKWFIKLPKKYKLLLMLGAVTLFLVILSSPFNPNASKAPVPTPTPTLTPLPVVTSGPTYTPVPTNKITPVPTTWTDYPNNGNLIVYGITLTYPFGWRVKYKLDTNSGNAQQALDFDFLPANMHPDASVSANMGWGGLIVYLYPSFPSVNEWLAKYFPAYSNNYTIPFGNIVQGASNQVTDIVPTAGKLPTLFIFSGPNHFYQVTYTSNYGVKGFSDILHSTIFPEMVFN